MDDSADDPDRSEPGLPPLRPVLSRGTRVPLLTAVLAVAAVIVFWLVGFLPWVLDGFQLDARRYGVSGDGLDRLWLPVPLVAGQLTGLVAFTVVGSVGAMLLPLLFPAVPRSLAVVVTGLTLVAAAVTLTSVTRIAIADRSGNDFASDSRVLDGLVVGVLALVVVGVVVGGAAAWQVGLLPVAVAVLVTQLLSWLSFLELPRPDLVAELTSVVLLGGAFVLSVRRSLAWLVTWPVALVIVWLGPPVTAATSAVAARLRPGQNLDESLGDTYRTGLEVFRLAVGDAPRTWWPQLVALGIGAGWCAVRHRWHRTAG
ncbi:MAG: hypothetical protein NTV23_17465 [Propionibacteriales bacterium]|nr:hypothetical protein [Propionibacteriales bacterium]